MPLAFPLYPQERDAEPCTVCVTGGLGMIAGSCVERLLEAGHTVHIVDIDADKPEAIEPFTGLPHSEERIKLFTADATKPGAIKEALQGCKYLIHTVSPVVHPEEHSKVKSELIEPAVKGTQHVLEAVNECESVERVVLTSSISAIYNEKKGPGEHYTEEDWADDTTLKHRAYSHSKRLAEQKAWEMEKAQKRWKLVCINPGHCVGPPICDRMPHGWTVELFMDLLEGKYMEEPHKDFAVVDVRDCAAAHCLAMVHPNANGRNICCEGTYTTRQLAMFLHEVAPTVRIPRLTLDAVHEPPARTVFNNQKLQKELGLKYHSPKQGLHDMYIKMQDAGYLPTEAIDDAMGMPPAAPAAASTPSASPIKRKKEAEATLNAPKSKQAKAK